MTYLIRIFVDPSHVFYTNLEERDIAKAKRDLSGGTYVEEIVDPFRGDLTAVQDKASEYLAAGMVYIRGVYIESEEIDEYGCPVYLNVLK
jgi:hypothetical protein